MKKEAKTIVHVNQHMLKYNKKHHTQFPVLTVKHRGKTYYGHEVNYHGSSTTRYQPNKPLSCGAVCWVETEGDVTVFDWTAVSKEGHYMITGERKTMRRLGSLKWMNSETSELVKDSDERFDLELSTAIDHEMAKNPSEWKQNEDTRYQEDPENWVD
jgi:hypothetical protein